ncbi:hypothetical protein [Sinomonas flava]|uniref:hypothetical protein n=1 Tax=Sinomonas flava TaxID=496857 RepID=UPI0039A4B6F9
MEHNRRVQDATGRTKGSIEFKFCNVSHVLAEAGHDYVEGYKPRSHVQESLRRSVLEAIGVPRTTSDSSWLPRSKKVGEQQVSSASRREPDRAEVSEEVLTPDLYDLLGDLWDRATGGTDVAARPDQAENQNWPSAMRPAGVAEACQWFDPERPHNGVPRLLFLVGGPGAGKSHATASVVVGLHQVTHHDDGLAHRVYRYSGSIADVLIINDATIGAAGNSVTPLAGEVDAVAALGSDRPVHLMACVNRGILVEEGTAIARAGHAARDSAGAAVLRWLEADSGTASGSDGGLLWWLQDRRDEGFVRSATLMEADRIRAYVAGVYVDECSLFEPRPSVHFEQYKVESATTYGVTRLNDRFQMDHRSIPAHDLFAQMSKRFSDMASGFAADPLLANLSSISNSALRANILTIARSAELTYGLRFTYRELWGLLARVLVGDAPQRMNREYLRSFIEDHQPDGIDPQRDFARWRTLAAFRTHQAIFTASTEAGREGAAHDPVLRMMRHADPVRDALPGNNPKDPYSGWVDPVNEALTSHHTETSPLEVLLQHDGSGLFEAAVGAFDEGLDKAYRVVMGLDDLPEKDRREAASWYGSYLMRLYAVAHGITAFRKEISVLLDAIFSAPSLPDRLAPGLHTLIRPQRSSRSSSDESFLPLYDSRAEPIRGSLDTPKLATTMDGLALATERVGGEQVILVLKRNGRDMGRIALDFPLVREALSCVDGFPGVTDLVESTAPRLERVRAVHLRSQTLAAANTEIRLVAGQGGNLVTVKG